jgi:hypothetical protein
MSFLRRGAGVVGERPFGWNVPCAHPVEGGGVGWGVSFERFEEVLWNSLQGFHTTIHNVSYRTL